jgi:hypothetical protein
MCIATLYMSKYVCRSRRWLASRRALRMPKDFSCARRSRATISLGDTREKRPTTRQLSTSASDLSVGARTSTSARVQGSAASRITEAVAMDPVRLESHLDLRVPLSPSSLLVGGHVYSQRLLLMHSLARTTKISPYSRPTRNHHPATERLPTPTPPLAPRTTLSRTREVPTTRMDRVRTQRATEEEGLRTPSGQRST